MGGKSAKVKGSKFERDIVKWHNDRSIPASRIPLSGALKGEYAGDIKIGAEEALLGECKRRARAWGDLYDAINQDDDSDIVFIRADNKPPLVVMPMETYECFLKWSNFQKKERENVY